MIESLAHASTAPELLGWIIVPIAIFLLSAAAAGVGLVIKGASYMARTQAAQESSADATRRIAQTLETYISKNDIDITDLKTKQAVHDAQLQQLEAWYNGGKRNT